MLPAPRDRALNLGSLETAHSRVAELGVDLDLITDLH